MNHAKQPLTYKSLTVRTDAGKVYTVTGDQIRPPLEYRIKHLTRAMWKAADAEDYGRAAELRDKINRLKSDN